MRPMDVLSLLRGGALDAELAALLWLLIEGRVPLVIAGTAPASDRSALAAALLSIDPACAPLVIDADAEPLAAERLAGFLRGDVTLGITLAAADLETVLERLVATGLPEDGVRRLGIVVVAEQAGAGPRCRVVHYLRPTERDAQGHVQRRPPAVLAARDPATGALEHYAWGITPELADRVDRAQADLEERHRERTRFLRAAVSGQEGLADWSDRVRHYLDAEPPRVPAPKHEPARPSPLRGGLTDPESHLH